MRRMPLVFRAWCRLMDALHIRTYRYGDSRLRYALTEPWEASYVVWYVLPRRFACQLLGRHNSTCRGRADHRRAA